MSTEDDFPLLLYLLRQRLSGRELSVLLNGDIMDDRFVGEGPETGVWCPDSMEIAKAYGIKAVEISNSEEVDTKIKEVLEYDGPVICKVKTPEWQLLIPRISSEKMPDGTLVSHEYEDMFPFLSREELEDNMVADREKTEKV